MPFQHYLNIITASPTTKYNFHKTFMSSSYRKSVEILFMSITITTCAKFQLSFFRVFSGVVAITHLYLCCKTIVYFNILSMFTTWHHWVTKSLPIGTPIPIPSVTFCFPRYLTSLRFNLIDVVS